MQLSIDTVRKVIESEDMHVSEEEFDDNFNAITSLVENGEYEEAVPLMESSFGNNSCDIRVTMFYLYLYVYYGGIKSFHEVLPFLNSLITTHEQRLSPLPKRDQHIQKSLSWFFSRLIKVFEKVKFSYNNNDINPLERVTAGLTEDMVSTMNKDVLTLNQTISSKWKKAPAENQLLSAQKSALDLSKIYFLRHPPTKEPVKAASSQEKKSSKTKKSQPQGESPKQEKKQGLVEKAGSYPYDIPLELLEPSQQMVKLYQKLQAFETLLQKADYQKAAIIAEDIEKRLEALDIVAFFPKLFVEYYSLYAKHSNKIGQEQDQVNPLLQKLYEADLESFISW